MTSDDLVKRSHFFHAVVRVIRDQAAKNAWAQREQLAKDGVFHWPVLECYDGTCRRLGVAPTGLVTRNCNWRDIRKLVTTFFQTAPDVDDDWKRAVRTTGFVPEDLHDLLLGVFLGGDDAPRPRYYIKNNKLTDAETGNPPTRKRAL